MVFKNFPLSLLATTLMMGLLASPAYAQLLYCCHDAKGIKQCSDSLPNQCVGRAYTVRGPGGKMIKEVEAPLTPEQRKAREEMEARKKVEEQSRKEQAMKDRALLTTYNNEAEIDRARDRAETDIKKSLEDSKKQLAVKEAAKAKLTDKNAIKEKMSREQEKRKLGDLDVEIKGLQEAVDVKTKELESVQQRFAEEKRRYSEIKGRSAGRY